MTNLRIEMRCDTEEKKLLYRAAAIKGKPTTTFIRELALRNAKRIVEEAETILVDAKTYEEILDMLDHPPEPSKTLRNAYKDYKASGL